MVRIPVGMGRPVLCTKAFVFGPCREVPLTSGSLGCGPANTGLFVSLSVIYPCNANSCHRVPRPTSGDSEDPLFIPATMKKQQ